MSTGTPFGPDELAMVERLWKKGYSYSQIARQLNDAFGNDRTRSAIAGVCFRNGWQNRPAPTIPTPRREKSAPSPRKPNASPSRFWTRFWTPEIIAEAIELRDQGLSRAAAHSVMSAKHPTMAGVHSFYDAMTRHKVHWPQPVRTPREKADQKKSTKPRAPWVEPVYEYDTTRMPVAVTIDRLARHQCRFPVGQHNSEHVFCADDVPDGLKYCTHHHARAYRGATRY